MLFALFVLWDLFTKTTSKAIYVNVVFVAVCAFFALTVGGLVQAGTAAILTTLVIIVIALLKLKWVCSS